MLADLPHGAAAALVVNEYYEGDGAEIYKHARALGCEGIVSKRIGSSYRSGDQRIGSRSRIRGRRRSHAKPRKIGVDNAARESPLPAALDCRRSR